MWIATDLEVEGTIQAESRAETLEALDDAVALHTGERGHEPRDAERRVLGIDPANNVSGEPADHDVSE